MQGGSALAVLTSRVTPGVRKLTTTTLPTPCPPPPHTTKKNPFLLWEMPPSSFGKNTSYAAQLFWAPLLLWENHLPLLLWVKAPLLLWEMTLPLLLWC